LTNKEINTLIAEKILDLKMNSYQRELFDKVKKGQKLKMGIFRFTMSDAMRCFKNKIRKIND